jgi:hypothetical protein
LQCPRHWPYLKIVPDEVQVEALAVSEPQQDVISDGTAYGEVIGRTCSVVTSSRTILWILS